MTKDKTVVSDDERDDQGVALTSAEVEPLAARKPRTRSKPVTGKTSRSKNSLGKSALQPQFFWLGVAFSIACLGTAGYMVLNGKACGGVEQYFLAMMLALPVGFLAWTFLGKIDIDGNDLGVSLKAGGGFALFVLVFAAGLKLPADCSKPGAEADVDAPRLSNARSNSSDLLSRLSQANHAFVKSGNASVFAPVHQEALNEIKALDAIRLTEDVPLREATLEIYRAIADHVASFTYSESKQAAREARLKAKASGQHALKAERIMSNLLSLPREQSDPVRIYLAGKTHMEQAQYWFAVSKILDLKWSVVEGAPSSTTPGEVHESFKKVGFDFQQHSFVQSDALVEWFCKTYQTEDTPC